MSCPSRPRRMAVFGCALALTLLASYLSWAQGLPQSAYDAHSAVSALDLAPSNPLGAPGGVGVRGSDSVYLNDRMLRNIVPLIPNLQAGYLYSFGKDVGAGRLTLDYALPVELSRGAVIFGEAHSEWRNFWKTIAGGAGHRIDLSLGGGYRKLLNANTLVGVNAFQDATRLAGVWYGSGGVGIEFASLLQGSDAVDLTLNYYGDLFNSDVLASTFTGGPENYDFQFGYSHELWNGGPDIRLSATGYRFSSGGGVYGARGGAELKSRDGMFELKYEASHDHVYGTYHEVGGFVNLGLRLSNLLNWESPFVAPTPVFKSPRNLRKWLTRKAQRRWRHSLRTWNSVCGQAQSRNLRFCLILEDHGSSLEIQDGAQYQTIPTLSGLGGVTQFRVEWKGLRGSSAQRINSLIFDDGDRRYSYSTYFYVTPSEGESPWMTFTSVSSSAAASAHRVGVHLSSNDMAFDLDGELCVVFR